MGDGINRWTKISGSGSLWVLLIVAAVSFISGGYVGYKYAGISGLSSADHVQKDKLMAVSYELENHLQIIDTEKEMEELERDTFFSGQELKNTVLENFIFSGAYIGLKNVVLSKNLIYLNQLYSKLKSSKERFYNYVWRLGNNSPESRKARIDIGKSWIDDREVIRRIIQNIMPMLQKEIELM